MVHDGPWVVYPMDPAIASGFFPGITRSILHGYKLILTSLLVLMGISTNSPAKNLSFFAGALWLIGNGYWGLAVPSQSLDLTGDTVNSPYCIPYWNNYPLVHIHFAMENHHFQWVNQL